MSKQYRKEKLKNKDFDKIADYDRLLLANTKLHTKINELQKIIDAKDKEIGRYKEFALFMKHKRANDWLFTYSDMLELNRLTKALGGESE